MSRYRTQLEVAKWVSAKDILLHCSLVSESWRKTCASQELWISLSEDYGIASDNDPEQLSQKQHFRRNRKMLALFSTDTLHLFNVFSGMWKAVPLDSTIAVDKSSAWAADRGGNWICTGGGAGLNQHYDMNGSTAVASLITGRGAVLPLPNMQEARKWHGTLVHLGHCYVFGGVSACDGDMKSCEKLELRRADGWTTVGNMHSSRSSFNPCLFREKIYLVAGKTAGAEIFDPRTSEFSPLEFEVEHEHSTAVVVEDQLAVFTCTSCIMGKKREMDYSYIWGNMNPCVHENVVFIPQSYNSFSVVKIDLATLTRKMSSPKSSAEDNSGIKEG